MRFAGLDNDVGALQANMNKPIDAHLPEQDYGEVAALPAAAAVAAKVIGGWAALNKAQTMLNGGAVNPGTVSDYANQDPTNKYNRHKQDRQKMNGAYFEYFQ